ncbi:MAG TPA: xanthine dehydrogenase family protein subunit M [Kofleriaceae bacterium]|nr:xanthine dehydrogenase family protein subunit M [Kofleriaceae bacterium]
MSEYLRPASLEEALRARRAHPDYTVLAGGTDLLVSAAHTPEPPGIIDLFGLPALVGVAAEADGTVAIGAATTYAQLLRSAMVERELPALWAASREVGALQIQARGTLGGNLATSSPVGDTLPVLLALDAVVELASESGLRRVPYTDFVTGYRVTALGRDELITAVRFPPRPAGARQYWRKMGTRRAQSISKVMLAACAQVEGGAIRHVRLGLGAVADRPVRARAAEAAVLGQPPGPEAAGRARAALAGEISPIDDVRSTAAYRLAAAQNVVGRFIESLAAP